MATCGSYQTPAQHCWRVRTSRRRQMPDEASSSRHRCLPPLVTVRARRAHQNRYAVLTGQARPERLRLRCLTRPYCPEADPIAPRAPPRRGRQCVRRLQARRARVWSARVVAAVTVSGTIPAARRICHRPPASWRLPSASPRKRYAEITACLKRKRAARALKSTRLRRGLQQSRCGPHAPPAAPRQPPKSQRS